MLNEQGHPGGEDEPDGMMSSLAKSKGARNGFFSVSFSSLHCWRLARCLHLVCSWREMSVISRQIGLRHDRTSFDKKKSKTKKWRRPTHGFLRLKSLVRQADEPSCKLMSFRLGFSREISPSYFMTKNSQTRTHRLFLPSVLKQLSSDTVKGCSSSS